MYSPGQSLSASDRARVTDWDLAVLCRRGRVWGSYRHLPAPAQSLQPSEHAFINTGQRGDLASLGWVQSEDAHAE